MDNDGNLTMDVAVFEEHVLVPLVAALNDQLEEGKRFTSSKHFEADVRKTLQPIVKQHGGSVELDPPEQGFPDIVLGPYGIEVKFTRQDTWRSIANSISQGTKREDVQHVYVVFAKMGGEAAVDWARYEDVVIHVRTSHVPRFEIELFPEGMPEDRMTLFQQMGISYGDFSALPMEEKMPYVRQYARNRLKSGEQLWWIEGDPDEEHSLPPEVRRFTNLEDTEKRRLRAEAALLSPEVVSPGRMKRKYEKVTMFLITYHGVVSTGRDLFTAGSVGEKNKAGQVQRMGQHIQNSLSDIESEMQTAAQSLDDALFVQYWGESVPRDQRIARWLQRADALATGWKPSDHLFLEGTGE